MSLKSEQLEKLAQGYLKAAQDKTVKASKRLQYRMEFRRGRILAKRFRELESQE